MHPDVIFLPGTKNTMEDLKWLRESGMETFDPESSSMRYADFWNLRRLSDAW